MALESLPVLDFSRLSAGPQEAEGFRNDLRDAMHEVGFLYLTGHGVPQELTDAVLDLSRRFFELPEEQKLALENTNSPQFRGYTRMGGELTAGEVDWREQIDVGVDRPAVERGPGIPDYWRLEGPNLWPETLPEMRPVVTEWMDRLSVISLELLRALALSLGAPEDSFDAAFAERAFPVLKIVRYPGESDPDPKQGVGQHRDGGVITLLLVEPGKGGLQVEHDGDWIDAPQVPGAFVVNIGEMLELATNGYLKATLHRVISPLRGTDRISVPFFYNPALDATMPQLAENPEFQEKARGLSVDPTNSPILQTYGDNALRYRMRAHPNVVAAQHADLLN
ncbi:MULTISPECIES: 2-oxoglutarate and iron-dependent oxygenase domain-containing protein [Arthrobacter]|uniref:2-oxoglutarate and iron-dependent oxygenase domain-containing protein n=2 Tax=Arthrobacter TaxID=1663 RepID=A0ABU9KPZ1_9MICC|nr:2-oxoglutarate and iron-dependent oxygenase domain-containing protein [Arthrobacter sp. YJM1]MDP5228311.1 2-oxoglutarate and iron-dependent oxygenase domain-containing protein [Arthrobacter sp. YJM1]